MGCEETAGWRLRINVVDTGPGISADKLDRLFIPFERLGAEQTGIEGTGLGLALSRRLLEAMGGTLGVDSVVGQGSTFWTELAIVEGPMERLQRVHIEGLPLSDAPGVAGTVLYIGDNLANLTLIEHLLAQRPG